MANRLPKRAKDLPPLEPDSDDELKTPELLLLLFYRKSGIQNVELDIFSNIRNPKRVSEFTPLKSDSDDDCEKNDRLNCAILNDSFILSPAKSLDFETPCKTANNNSDNILETNKINPENIANKEDSFSRDFKKLAINEKENETSAFGTVVPKSRHKLFPTSSAFKDKEFPKTNLLLFNHKKSISIQECELSKDKNLLEKKKSRLEYGKDQNALDRKDIRDRLDIDVSPQAVMAISSAENIICPKSPIEPNEIPNSVLCETKNTMETPYKTVESNFITPQVKSFQMPVSRRPSRLLSSNTSQKSRSLMENEFKSQKILFRTPIPMSRPPVSSLGNNSINLSLDDTLKEKKERTLSPVDEIKILKKSSEDLFSGTTKLSAEENPEGKLKTVIINGKEYVLQKKLGSGGSSSVFLAELKDSNLNCALKIVDLRGDKSVVEGYLNETKLLAKLQGNENVVSLYEYEHLVKQSKLYMVMEKGDSDLNKILQAYKTDLPLYKLINFWYQMLQSVNYIHENGVIHSDLKPANFLMVNGRLKLIDFGIASNISIDSTSIIKFSQAGTFNYISPEALIDTSTGNSPMSKNHPKIKISTKSDVWSLGCILYLLLYKKTPFGHIKNVYAKVNAISNPSTEIEYPELPFYYPQMLIEMAKKCLQHNPKKRSSVAELLKYPFNMIIPISSSHQLVPE